MCLIFTKLDSIWLRAMDIQVQEMPMTTTLRNSKKTALRKINDTEMVPLMVSKTWCPFAKGIPKVGKCEIHPQFADTLIIMFST